MKTHSAATVRPRKLAPGLLVIAFATLVSLPLGAQTATAPPASAAPKPVSAKQLMFDTPQAGVDALVAAMRANDAKQLARLLGPGHERVIDSGDTVADRAAWARFVADYDAKHAFQMDGDAKAALLIGSGDWPMPIPLVKRSGGWAFDTPAGVEELVARRIGRNELDTIQACLAFVDMEREYAEEDRDGDGLLAYAARLYSSPGKRDGLYWPAKAGEAQSPAGPRFADADPKSKAQGGGLPYRGYYYRVLTAQGKSAPGGARSYSVNGKLIGGIALVAYPAKYMVSGVKTFICSMDGIVYERDLGPGTAAAATRMNAYDPDSNWTPIK